MTYHRSGWPDAVAALAVLHHPDGVLFDDFLSRRFLKGYTEGILYNPARPYTRPWLGVVHDPPAIPAWFDWSRHAPQAMIDTVAWRESLPHCRGLFTLSRYLRDWLVPRVPVPVEAVLHPVGEPAVSFDLRQFLASPLRRILHIGWWLRRIHSFCLLPTSRYRRTLLQVDSEDFQHAWQAETAFLPTPQVLHGVEVLSYRDARAYDALLAGSIVFLDLYDSSANNVVVECLIRGTPLVVNRLPAVVEYLGEDYPLYFDSLEEAARKAENDRAVTAAHQHMLANPIRAMLSVEHFVAAIAESQIYQSLGDTGNGSDD
jgi:hypothetical protein